MTLDLRKIMSYIQNDLQRNWGGINFEYKNGDGRIDITANLTLNNHDDDIRFIITVYEGGGTNFRAVFDKVEKSSTVLNLLNQFNASNLCFNAFIRDDGYLELRHWYLCYIEEMLRSYSNEVLARLAKLADNETLKSLTKYTHN